MCQGGEGGAEHPPHPLNAWVKRTPLEDAPVSPRMGYEGACVWDGVRKKLIRYGGHNQGGGGEQGAEVWTFDPLTAVWELKHPNVSPPGVCCNAQNVFATTTGRYVRFPFFSGGHGWQWPRELYLNDSSVWTYDLAENRWRNMRPLPAPRLAPYRSASWDGEEGVAVVFGGEGGNDGTQVYDPWTNEWRAMRPAVEPESRSGGQMAYDAARKLHVLFGSQFSDDQHTWAYDLKRNEWRDMRPPEQPPTFENDPVLTYDPLNRMVLAIVKITTGKDEDATHEVQTWAYDAGGNRWQRLSPRPEPEAAGNRTRNLVFAPELNLAILENCTSQPREQQVWTYRYGEASTPYAPTPSKRRETPPIVEDVVASVLSPSRVELSWRPAAAAEDNEIVGYHAERAVVEVLSEDQLTRLKSRTAPLTEPAVGAIRRIGAFERLTEQPIAISAVADDPGITFVDDAVDLATPQAITGEPIFEHELHREELDDSGHPYRFAVFAYRVRAVNAAGALSGPSPAAFTLPSSPQHLFSREEGETCRLKWAANPEQKIAGYRVYRMDGRWDSDAISRLTAAPQEPTTFADESAGKESRRYYVVAVDDLGQEGFPSSPVWFQREWGEYYKPFVGEWHQ